MSMKINDCVVEINGFEIIKKPILQFKKLLSAQFKSLNQFMI